MGKRKESKFSKLLDIVIPVFGRFDLLDKCLASIPENDKYSITIVDDFSPNQEEADKYYLDKKSMGYRVIRNKQNHGFPRTCNQGASVGYAPLILLLNSDVILDEKAIEYMIKEMDEPTTGIVGMKLIFPEYVGEGLIQSKHMRPANKIQHVGVHFDINANPIHSFLGWSEDNPKILNMDRTVYMISGSVLMTRRNIWRKVEGLDEAYGRGTWEDLDYCMKVKKLGYNIRVSHEARGIHYVSGSSEYYRVPFPLNENQIKFMDRWGRELEWTEWKVM